MPELLWSGKYRDAKKIAPSRVALPLQTVETVGGCVRGRTFESSASDPTSAWRNRLVCGDGKYVLPSLRPEFSAKVDLVYVDPPFATGADFSVAVDIPAAPEASRDPRAVLKWKAYRDTWSVSPEERARGVGSKDKYLGWFAAAAALLRELLADSGLLFVHLDDNVGHEAKVVLDEIFGPDRFRGEIVWRLGTGAKSRKFFSIQHNTILVYSAGDSWTFNPKEKIAREPFAEGSLETHFRHVGEDGRRYRIRTANGKDYKYYEDEGRLIGSVWADISSMTANSPILAEGTGYPTQKPEKLLERIIGVCTGKNDLVLDCFCGSGTAAVVAEKLGRRWIACDVSPFAVHTTRKRLLSIPGVKPFAVQSLGKYERTAWAAEEFPTDESSRMESVRHDADEFAVVASGRQDLPVPAGADRDDAAAVSSANAGRCDPAEKVAGELPRVRMDAYRRFILRLFGAEPLSCRASLHGAKARGAERPIPGTELCVLPPSLEKVKRVLPRSREEVKAGRFVRAGGIDAFRPRFLHGTKAGRFVHVGAIDTPVTAAHLEGIARDLLEFAASFGRTGASGVLGSESAGSRSHSGRAAGSQSHSGRAAGSQSHPGRAAGDARLRPGRAWQRGGADVLGWEFAPGLKETACRIAAETDVRFRLRLIPRDVLDARAVEQNDLREKDFFELRSFSTETRLDVRRLSVHLTDFVMPSGDLREEVTRAIEHWSQWIDYWAVDWDHKGGVFRNRWRSYRTRGAPELELSAAHEYPRPGEYAVAIQVVDLLGCAATATTRVKVE